MAFVERKFARAGQTETSGRFYAPMAPGAVDSPQEPGEVPDRSSVPGHDELPVAIPEEGPRRPLTEYKTAQRIMGVYAKEDLDPLDPERFVQAPPGYEEIRKLNPIQRQPLRPIAGYALHVSGTRLNTQLAELAAESDADRPIDPGQ